MARPFTLLIGGTALLGILTIILLVIAAANDAGRPSNAAAKTPTLNIAGGRGLTDLVITSRESATLSRCDITLLDDRTQWVAVLAAPITPSQTVRVPWYDFKQNGQPLPSYIARARSNFLVSCVVGGYLDDRRSAGIHF